MNQNMNRIRTGLLTSLTNYLTTLHSSPVEKFYLLSMLVIMGLLTDKELLPKEYLNKYLRRVLEPIFKGLLLIVGIVVTGLYAFLKMLEVFQIALTNGYHRIMSSIFSLLQDQKQSQKHSKASQDSRFSLFIIYVLLLLPFISVGLGIIKLNNLIKKKKPNNVLPIIGGINIHIMFTKLLDHKDYLFELSASFAQYLRDYNEATSSVKTSTLIGFAVSEFLKSLRIKDNPALSAKVTKMRADCDHSSTDLLQLLFTLNKHIQDPDIRGAIVKHSFLSEDHDLQEELQRIIESLSKNTKEVKEALTDTDPKKRIVLTLQIVLRTLKEMKYNGFLFTQLLSFIDTDDKKKQLANNLHQAIIFRNFPENYIADEDHLPKILTVERIYGLLEAINSLISQNTTSNAKKKQSSVFISFSNLNRLQPSPTEQSHKEFISSILSLFKDMDDGQLNDLTKFYLEISGENDITTEKVNELFKKIKETITSDSKLKEMVNVILRFLTNIETAQTADLTKIGWSFAWNNPVTLIQAGMTLGSAAVDIPRKTNQITQLSEFGKYLHSEKAIPKFNTTLDRLGICNVDPNSIASISDKKLALLSGISNMNDKDLNKLKNFLESQSPQQAPQKSSQQKNSLESFWEKIEKIDGIKRPTSQQEKLSLPKQNHSWLPRRFFR